MKGTILSGEVFAYLNVLDRDAQDVAEDQSIAS